MKDRLKDFAGNVIHNCLIHPLTPFLPKRAGDWLHDWSLAKFWPVIEVTIDEDKQLKMEFD